MKKWEGAKKKTYLHPLPTGSYAYARMSSTVNKDANINRRKTGRLLTRNIREGFLLIIQLLAISNEKLTKLMSESKGCVQHNPLMLEAGGGRPNVRSLTISLRHLSHSGRKLDSQNDLEQWRYQGGIWDLHFYQEIGFNLKGAWAINPIRGSKAPRPHSQNSTFILDLHYVLNFLRPFSFVPNPPIPPHTHF